MIKEDNNLNVLIAEDSNFFLANVENILNSFHENFDITNVSKKSEILELIDFNVYDIVILDLQLKDGNTFDLIHIIKEKIDDIVILVISGQMDIRIALKTLDAGAQYYIAKGEAFNSDMLSAMNNILEKINLKNQNRKLRDAVFEQSNFPTVLYQLSEIGVEVIYRDFKELPEKIKVSTDEFLLNLGISFTMLLGRGEEYTEGCFSFPATNSKFYDVLLFSFTLPNPSATDSRLTTGFYQFCLFIPKSFLFIFPHVTEMMDMVKVLQSYFVDSNHINSTRIEEMKLMLLEKMKYRDFEY